MEKFPFRKSIRLKGYDYSSPGYYFITICVKNGRKMFGNVVDGQLELTECGTIAERNLINIPHHVKDVIVDKYVVMPNHVHIIVVVGTRYIASDTRYIASDKRTPYMASLQDNGDVGTPYMVSVQAKSKQTLSKAMQQYKASVSRDTAISGLWQPRFYDEIIRNEEAYRNIWRYIDENPMRWNEDMYYK
jgi:REP element-mobilizing transposase RayT